MSAYQSSKATITATDAVADDEAGTSVDSLYQLYWVEIRNHVAKTFGAGPPDPEDVAQAAFEKITSAENLDSIRNPRAFLYRVAHNIAVSQYRRLRTRRNYVDQAIASDGSESADDLHPERVILARERLSVLEDAYRELPVLQQELLVMHRLHDVSYAEIARRKSMSQTEVKRQIAKAVVACQAHLERALAEPRLVREKKR